MPPLPAQALEAPAMTVLSCSVAWVLQNFPPPARVNAMLPCVLHIDQKGVVSGVAFHEFGLDEKYKIGAVIHHAVAAFPACAYVSEAWWSKPTPAQAKAGEDMAVAVTPRNDPRAVEVVSIRLYAGSRCVWWKAQIVRVPKTRLEAWILEADTAEGFYLKPVTFT
jgi:hypothetical protein